MGVTRTDSNVSTTIGSVLRRFIGKPGWMGVMVNWGVGGRQTCQNSNNRYRKKDYTLYIS